MKRFRRSIMNDRIDGINYRKIIGLFYDSNDSKLNQLIGEGYKIRRTR